MLVGKRFGMMKTLVPLKFHLIGDPSLPEQSVNRLQIINIWEIIFYSHLALKITKAIFQKLFPKSSVEFTWEEISISGDVY